MKFSDLSDSQIEDVKKWLKNKKSEVVIDILKSAINELQNVSDIKDEIVNGPNEELGIEIKARRRAMEKLIEVISVLLDCKEHDIIEEEGGNSKDGFIT